MPPSEEHRVICHLDELLAARGMTLVELAEQVGITVANLSILKNNRAKAVRFSTLTALCEALECTPGDLFTVVTEKARDMSRVKNYLGLEAQEPQPAENHFSLSLIYSLVLLVLFAYLLVTQWPEAGIPSPLKQYNPELTGGTHWISEQGLTVFAQGIAWLSFAWKFSIYLTLTFLLYRLAKAFHTKADFTSRALSTVKIAQYTLLLGMIGYSILLYIVESAVEKALGTELVTVPTFLSEQGLLTLLFLATLFFIEGALRRGLTLQEETDATI